MNLNPKTIDSLLEEKPEDRSAYLGLLPPNTREQMIELWAKDDRLKITDIVFLNDEHKTPLCQHLAGNKKLPASDRVFFLAPNPNYVSPDPDTWPITAETPIMLENGSRNSITQYVKIDRPTAIPAARAILAITLFGPKAENKHERNRLIELTAAEYGLWASDSAEKMKKNAAKKALEEAEAARVAYEKSQANAKRLAEAAGIVADPPEREESQPNKKRR